MALSPQDFEGGQLARLVETTRTLVQRHPCTWPLADRLAEASRDVADAGPFRVGIVGVQNAGKSTLLNALTGQTVAPVSNSHVQTYVTYVEACPPGDEPHIVVEYTDESGRAPERLPIERLGEFVERAPDEEILRLRTRCVSDLLNDVTIIDTPGLATRDGKSDVTARFLAAEERSLVHAERAEAIIAVFPLIPQNRDLEAARLFGGGRLMSVSPLNAIAVLERWNQHPEEAAKGSLEDQVAALAEKYRTDSVLKDHVSTVMPVNGALFAVAQRANDNLLEALVSLGRRASDSVMEDIRTGETFFRAADTTTICGLSPDELRSGIDSCLQAGSFPGTSSAYPLMRYILGLVGRSPNLTGAMELRARLRELSAIDSLREFLKYKFLDHRAHIRAGGILSRMARLIDEAVHLLEEAVQQTETDAALFDRAARSQSGPTTADDDPLRAALAAGRRRADGELTALHTTVRALTREKEIALMAFQNLDRDIKYLGTLNQRSDRPFGSLGISRADMSALLGFSGWTLEARLNLASDADQTTLRARLAEIKHRVGQSRGMGSDRELISHLRGRVESLKPIVANRGKSAI
jgi:hypothetical protein